MEKIRSTFTPSDGGKKSVSELLIGFFKFYLQIFKPEEHAISISDPKTSLISKSEYKSFLETKFAACPHISSNLIEPFYDYALFIVEPFDLTVNKGDTVPVKRLPELILKLNETLHLL